ncbi:CDP-paratose 2-epimerase [Fundidesulfovibrio magnetotacticus]|uniref:CDP-paratose 2-epimerase n=1 Tax=Fundidesulfovibrio magnetotacticus TaxID=2730080 RepID=A0A6V8LX26_9BACT|nr:NAD-dependent epimerase/dehydratase family protein [Fundidesulfovibrio magnetotacticus]GFK94818.1 CDP-paratose 2-epimerase [Fundidesulfovibrio magnetotacticus]
MTHRDGAILVTGGAGFVGSNLAMAFKNRYPGREVLVLDNLKRRGSEYNLPRLADAGIRFVHGDIRNPEDLRFETPIGLLLECSAEPSVLAGFGGSPEYLVNTNLTGTINCLEMCRLHKADVVFLSTSRVYAYDPLNAVPVNEGATRLVWAAQTGPEGWSPAGVSERFPIYGAKTMYGATKLCSEFVLEEYRSMYGLRGVVNRCGVIAGPWQFGKVDQGVFSLWMQAHYFKRPLKYIGFGGQGKQVRDLFHPADLFDLIELQLADWNKADGGVFNVGGGLDVSLSLLETTLLCQEITGNKVDIAADPVNRPADMAIYVTDTAKVRETFGWGPKKSARDVLEDLHAWVKDNEKALEVLAKF